MRRFIVVVVVASILALTLAGGAVASVANAPRNSLSTNLVAHWRFEETSWTRYDELNGCGGSGCDFTSNNSVGYAAGKLGTNAEKTLSASNQYLSVANHADLSLGSNKSFTMCFWFSHTVGNYEAISKGTGTVTSSDYTFLIYDTSVVLYVGSATSASVSWAGGTAWHFICGWHDLSNNQIGLSIDDGTPVTASQSSNTAYGAALFVGSYASSSTNSTIDSLSFWSRKISAAEITQLYNSGSGCDYVSGAWTCEATSTPTATNTATATATATNTATPTATPLPWYLADTQTLSGFTLAAGSVSSTWASDNARAQYNEASATTNQTIEYTFPSFGHTSLTATWEGYYTGSHSVKLQCYNYAIASYSDLATLGTSLAADETIAASLPTGCEPTDAGSKLKVRILHAAGGNGSHIIYSDYIALSTSAATATPTATNLPATNTPTATATSLPTATPTATYTPNYQVGVTLSTGNTFLVSRSATFGEIGVIIIGGMLFAAFGIKLLYELIKGFTN